MTYLNPNLIKHQNLSDDDVLELEILHETKNALFEQMKKLDIDEDIELLHTYVILLESLEFNMQRVWKFTQDRNFHSWWSRAPHCTCNDKLGCKLHSAFVNREQP